MIVLRESRARLKRNRSIRLCFHSFVPVPTLGGVRDQHCDVGLCDGGHASWRTPNHPPLQRHAQLHHRDPSIIGLLDASPHISPPSSPATSSPTSPASPASPILSARIPSSQVSLRTTTKPQSEAFDDHETPPQSPMLAASRVAGRVPRLGLHLEKGQVADLEFERPFYELIVDGIHSHPNSVRVCPSRAFINLPQY